MDFKQVENEIMAEEKAWKSLFSKYPILKEYFSKIDHSDKQTLLKSRPKLSEEQKTDILKRFEAATEAPALKVSTSDLHKVGELIGLIRNMEKELMRLKELEARVNCAYEVYLDTSEDKAQGKRLRKAARVMKWTNGKRPKTIDKRSVFLDYISMVFDKEKPKPKDKWEALELIAEKHGIANASAALKTLQGYIKKLRLLFEKEMHRKEPGFDSYMAASFFVKNKDGRTKFKFPGILPPNYPPADK